MNKDWDAIVIGAGPAGAFTALELAKKYDAVLLVDKAPFPRYKVCGACLNRQTLMILHRSGLQNLPALKEGSPVQGLTLYRKGVSAQLELPAGLAVLRSRFDHDLAMQAQTEGAVFLSNRQAFVHSLPKVNSTDLATVSIESAEGLERVRCKAVVVADGLNGTSLKAFKHLAADVSEKSKVGLGTVLSADAKNCERFGNNQIHMFMNLSGYLGIVRLSDGSLDLACAIDKAFLNGTKSPGQIAFDLIAENGVVPPEGLLNARFHGTDRLTRHRSRVAENRLFIVGDASAYTEPFTGQGIAWALHSALLAAGEISLAIEATTIYSLNLATNNWQSVTRRKLRTHQILSRLVAKTVTNGGTLGRVMFASLVRYPSLSRQISSFVIDQINSEHVPSGLLRSGRKVVVN